MDGLRVTRCRAPVPSSKDRTTRSKTKAAQRGLVAQLEQPRAKRARILNAATVRQHCCVVCGGNDGRFTKCFSCRGEFHLHCVRPPRRTKPAESWTCDMCTRPERLRPRTRAKALPHATTRPAVTKVKAHSAMIVSSVIARMSKDPGQGQRVAAAATTPSKKASTTTQGEQSHRSLDCGDVGMRNVTDAVVAWAMRRADAVDAAAAPSVADGTGATPAAGERQDRQRLNVFSRRGAGDATRGGMLSDGNAPMPRCYCGVTDETRETMRCVSCASVFHSTCMDPPYSSVQSVPPGGYTCLSCRPTCGVCYASFRSGVRSSTRIVCVSCRTSFHSACCNAKATDERCWKCTKCASRTADDNASGQEERDVNAARRYQRYPGEPRARPKPWTFAGQHAPSATVHALSGGGVKRAENRRACVVCGVAEGKKMNVCGSCGDAYHSLCLDRPRTRRAGDSWRCDSCRVSSPIAPDASTAMPPRPSPCAAASLAAGALSRRPLQTNAARDTVPRRAEGRRGSDARTAQEKGNGPAAAAKRKPGWTRKEGGIKVTGFWTEDEHNRFLHGIEKHPAQWTLVANVVGTRTPTQCRSHAQKYFMKISHPEKGRLSTAKGALAPRKKT